MENFQPAQNIQLDEVPEGKVYKTSNIGIAAFFGGIFVAAYLIAENFKALGNARSARFTWAIAVGAFIFIIALSLIPAFNNIPSIAYAAAYTGVASWVARRYQMEAINKHIDKGGQVYSSGRVVAISLIGLGVTAAFVLLLFFIEDNLLWRV